MREQNEKRIGYFRGERDAFRAAIEHPFRRVESESSELESSSTLWFHGNALPPMVPDRRLCGRAVASRWLLSSTSACYTSRFHALTTVIHPPAWVGRDRKSVV